MRLRNFKRGLYKALEKAEKNKRDGQTLLVMINENESDEIINFLSSENILFQKFSEDVVGPGTVKFTFVDKNGATIGFIKKEESTTMKNLVDVKEKGIQVDK